MPEISPDTQPGSSATRRDTPGLVRLSRGYRLLISALTAGLLAGLVSYAGGADVRAAVLGGAIMFLKDAQAYLSSAPGAPQ